MRRLLTALLLMTMLTIGIAAPGSANGNNGTVKIVDAQSDYDLDKDNDPHVCSFYIAGFGFDAGQTGTYYIVGQPPTPTATGTNGGFRANNEGNWATPSIRLADGHYKLTVDTGKGDGKHKVFWVECPKSDQPISPSLSPKPTGMQPGPTLSPSIPPPVGKTPAPTKTPATVEQLPSTSTE